MKNLPPAPPSVRSGRRAVRFPDCVWWAYPPPSPAELAAAGLDPELAPPTAAGRPASAPAEGGAL